MASKFTKVTRPRRTDARWRALVRVRFTGVASDGPRRTPSPRSTRSRAAELLCRDALNARGWRELTHDVLCAGVQVDLIGRAPSGVLTLVEVKMNTALDRARLTPRQAARLARAAVELAAVEPVELVVALVEGSKVRLLPVDALTVGRHVRHSRF